MARPKRKSPKILAWYQAQQTSIKAIIIGALIAGVFGCITAILSGFFALGAAAVPSLMENPTTTPTVPQTQPFPNSPSATITPSPIAIPLQLKIASPIIGVDISSCEFTPIIPDDINPFANPELALQEFATRMRSNPLSIKLLNATLIDMTITSISQAEWIRLSNKVLAKIICYEPLSDSANVYFPGCGGSGEFRDFVFRINNSPGIEFTSSKPDIDYYSLQPGEFEVFNILLKANAPGLYEIRLGIEYTYGGITSQVWTTETFILLTPEEYQGWSPSLNLPQFVLSNKGKFDNGEYIKIHTP